MQISEKRLEWYQRVEAASRDVLMKFPVDNAPVCVARLHEALESLHTSLVSDEEIYAVWNPLVKDPLASHPAALRKIGALYWRTGADELDRRGVHGGGPILRELSEEEVGA